VSLSDPFDLLSNIVSDFRISIDSEFSLVTGAKALARPGFFIISCWGIPEVMAALHPVAPWLPLPLQGGEGVWIPWVPPARPLSGAFRSWAKKGKSGASDQAQSN